MADTQKNPKESSFFSQKKFGGLKIRCTFALRLTRKRSKNSRSGSSVWLEYMPVTHGVAGSSPVQTAKLLKRELFLCPIISHAFIFIFSANPLFSLSRKNPNIVYSIMHNATIEDNQIRPSQAILTGYFGLQKSILPFCHFAIKICANQMRKCFYLDIR